MAVKKKAEEATNDTEAAGTEKEEKTVNNKDEQEKVENGVDNEATDGTETEQETETTEKEEVVKLAYIGPTLPAGQLKCNKIFIGTETEIKKELEAVLEKYPLVEKMLVPASQIGEKKDKAKTAGNILHKYYADIVSSVAGNATKEG